MNLWMTCQEPAIAWRKSGLILSSLSIIWHSFLFLIAEKFKLFWSQVDDYNKMMLVEFLKKHFFVLSHNLEKTLYINLYSKIWSIWSTWNWDILKTKKKNVTLEMWSYSNYKKLGKYLDDQQTWIKIRDSITWFRISSN